MTRQAFSILAKIREVDSLLGQDHSLRSRVREVHPEVCFARWNGGQPMLHKKSKPEGRVERETLIDAEWPGERERLLAEVRRFKCKADDLNDAFAALWSARRIHAGRAVVLSSEPPIDAVGLRMEIVV